MTVIAFDGKTVAADRQATTNGYKRPSFPKIMRFKDCILGAVGMEAVSRAMMAWYMAGADPSEFPNAGRKEAREMAWLLVIKADGSAFEFQDLPIPIRLHTPAAWGSGREGAMGAMLAGATALEAVLIASQLDDGCGFGADFLNLEDPADERDSAKGGGADAAQSGQADAAAPGVHVGEAAGAHLAVGGAGWSVPVLPQANDQPLPRYTGW